ncbi:MAG: carboxypeptidase regulatory-like domain-containing protein, partial [Bryobacteraceae bacterium]
MKVFKEGTNMTAFSSRFLVAASLCLISLAPLQAQLSNSTIKGTVTDATGGVVPGTSVTLTNLGTGEHRQQTTTANGNYDFTALSPGEYEVKASASGFAEWSGKLTLRVAQDAEINPVLQAATVATSVQVNDVTPVITTDNSSLSDVKEAERIAALPMQNRNFLNILNFTPGVVSNSFAGQGQGYTRVNGIPGGSMDYLVDGSTAAERYTNELQRLPQPLPTIQEVKVDTSNGSAEYSRPGVVEVVTKSGTNDYHGQLFELNQNSDLTARAFHQKSVNFLVHNEFGGNFSGPLWLPKIYNGKNKTFFFIDAEGIRQSSAAQERYTVPLASWKAGDFSTYTDSNGQPVTVYDPTTTHLNPATGAYERTPFPGNALPASRISAVSQKVVSHLPDPNVNIAYYLGQNYQNPDAAAVDDNTLVTAKVDQLFGQNRLSGRYTYTDKTNFGVGYFLNPENRLYGGNNGALSFTQLITPTIINEVRTGVQQFHAYRG